MDKALFQKIQAGEVYDPHESLGLFSIHPQKQVIRLWRPQAHQCTLEIQGKQVEASRVDPSGGFEYELPFSISPLDYRVYHPSGQLAHDPYSFGPVAGELDLHLAAKGVHYELYNFLGAHPKVHQGVSGVYFAVWAPNAASVFLIGKFNDWHRRANPMRSLGSAGIWELFIPGLSDNEPYLYLIVTRGGEEKAKADPCAHAFEPRPSNNSVVASVDRFVWSDEEFLRKRGATRRGEAPLVVYEVHPGSWKQKDGKGMNYREMAHHLVDYCTSMHFTHIELMGICEYPLDESWGYQVVGYFAPTSRFGSVEDFQYFVNHLHTHNIGVLLDWVPAHFAVDEYALARFDGTSLYEHTDARQGFHPHWKTLIFNYGRAEVTNFLIASALFWLEKMHIDGLRVDAVASMLYLDYGRNHGEWIPNQFGSNINCDAIEFLKHLNSIVHQRVPGALMIAEESTCFEGMTRGIEYGGFGFDLKWCMGWMHDTLLFFSKDFVWRPYDVHRLTLPFLYAFTEKFILPLSHDEVVHGKRSLLSKMPGNEWEQMANLRQLFTWMMTFPGKKLLFMGGEMGQRSEWNCKEELHWGLLRDPKHQKLQQMVAHLNHLYLTTRPLHGEDHVFTGFERFDPGGGNPLLIGYLRKSGGEKVYALHNLCPIPMEKVFIPLQGVSRWDPLFCSDDVQWGGAGLFEGRKALLTPHGVEVAMNSFSSLIVSIS